MRKVVVLNSGGFDSIVLMNDLRSCLEVDSEIHSLHFLYFAKNEKQQLKCVRKVCEKLDIENKVICLPRFDWTKNDFYRGGDNMYLEGRNLVFLSYAISYAESIGADAIYLATLLSYGYVDTSISFLQSIRELARMSGIDIIAPYCESTKQDILYLATHYDIKYDDFFTCDKPINNEPCHECEDCKILDTFFKNDIPVKAFIRNGSDPNDKEFKELFKEEPVTELRVLINNECQLKCSHCFYGFDEMKSEPISVEKMKEVIKESAELGIKNFHFSGKEPLFNELIFEYAQYIRDNFKDCTFDVVTNGINVPKYIDKLKECGFQKVFLSVDNVISENGVRSVNNRVALNALGSLKEKEIPIEIFIDLHENNFDKVYDILTSLKSYGFKSTYIRTIKSIGGASDFKLLSVEDINKTFKQIEKFSEENPDIFVTLYLGGEYAETIRNSDSELSDVLFVLENEFGTLYRFNNFSVYAEIFCARYENTITVTPDGYILGCATEVSNKDYDRLSVGNVKDNSLKELIERGKELSLDTQCDVCMRSGKYCLNKCPHTLI